jgi:preprotein translocase subunit SecE
MGAKSGGNPTVHGKFLSVTCWPCAFELTSSTQVIVVTLVLTVIILMQINTTPSTILGRILTS